MALLTPIEGVSGSGQVTDPVVVAMNARGGGFATLDIWGDVITSVQLQQLPPGHAAWIDEGVAQSKAVSIPITGLTARQFRAVITGTNVRVALNP